MYDFQKVDKTQVPDEVLDVFEARRDKLVGRGKAHEFPFEFFYRVDTDDNHVVYFARHNSEYTNSNIHGAVVWFEESTYFINYVDGHVAGISELRLIEKYDKKFKSFFKDKPFQGWTRTYDGFKGVGLATTRLFVQDQYCRQFYGLRLYSDSNTSIEMCRIWDGLVGDGIAKRWVCNRRYGNKRYRFIN